MTAEAPQSSAIASARPMAVEFMADTIIQAGYAAVMKSPFPGMDPYLERHWGDLHHRLIQYSCDALQPALPGDLRARVEERVFLESDPGLMRLVVPDMHVAQVRETPAWRASMPATGGAAVAEPLVFEVHSEPITEGYLEIRERGGGKVITVIEFLSPANKLGGVGQEKYQEKQDEVLRSDASLVEIDLVRTGRRVLALPHYDIPVNHRSDYLACVSPGWKHGRRELFPMPLRQRLPVLPIPLRQHERPIPLDLQALLDHAYATGRYDDTDYRAELDPPLPAEDSAWAAELLKTAGKC